MEIKQLAVALSKAQATIEHASKDAMNPHFDKKYADLASVWDACRRPLTENGLSVTQVMVILESGAPALRTVLLHESGEYIDSLMQLALPANANMQHIGSSLSYARRYALAAIAGVAQADDDANLVASAAPAPARAAPAQAAELVMTAEERQRRADLAVWLRRYVGEMNAVSTYQDFLALTATLENIQNTKALLTVDKVSSDKLMALFDKRVKSFGPPDRIIEAVGEVVPPIPDFLTAVPPAQDDGR